MHRTTPMSKRPLRTAVEDVGSHMWYSSIIPNIPGGPMPPSRVAASSPAHILAGAVRRVPQLVWAYGVLGLLAVLAIAKTLVTSPLFALVGIAGLLVCMTVIYFFARAVEQSADVVAMPVVVFTWFMLLVFMGIIGCLFTSIFFNAPLELKDKLFSREVAAAAADAGLKDLASKVKGLSPDALIEIARINVSLNGAVGTGPGADDLFLVKPSAGLLDLDRHNLIEWSM